MTFELTATFRQTSGCEISQMSDGVVVYQTEKERVHYLNPAASLIYDLCRESQSVEAIADYLMDAFSLLEPPRGEVTQCIGQLLAEGLISRC